MDSPYKIILADDHPILRQGIRHVLERIPGISVIGEADDGAALLALIREIPADLVVLDIFMPHLRGIEAIGELKAIQPKIRTLILTMHADLDYFHQAAAAGAEGYLLKTDAPRELKQAISAIRDGEIYVSPIISRRLAGDVMRKHRPNQSATVETALTLRQREILKLIAEGKTNPEIAAFFSISVRTVEHHRANILEKLNLKNTAELVRYAIQKGYIV